MGHRRLDRLNSLLKEVISDVIRTEVKNPHLSPLFTVTEVDITKDLQHAKVYISVIGSKQEKTKTLAILQSAAGFIRSIATKQIVIRYFPELTFLLDESLEKQIHMEELLYKIRKEREEREEKERGIS
jgi:ribosome-binding factor A